VATRRSLIASAIVVGASVSSVACSLFALDGFSGDEVAAVDAEASPNDAVGADAGSEAAPSAEDAAPSCGAAAGNLLVGQNEGFEDGCALWESDRSSLSATTTASCGKQACRVCPYYVDIGNAFFAPAGMKVRGGERYVFSVKMRRDGESASIQARTGLSIPTANEFYNGTIPLMSDWGSSTTTVEIPAGADGHDLRLDLRTISSSEGECFIVDEATLVRTKDAGP
jgi:hypothetical protein